MEFNIHGLEKRYPGGKTALNGLELTLTAPMFVGLLGPNGAGKSTLMKLLTLGLLPSAGKILLDGAPLQKQQRQLRQKLGYLPQEYGLYEELTVYQFLDYMACLKNLGSKSKQHIERVLPLCGLYERKRNRIGSLSGGYKQRVGIAQALLGDPELIILDEPTVGLDPEERVRMRNVFVETARDKIMILSTHIIEDVQSVCNRLIVLNRGRICYDGTPDGLIAQCLGHVGIYECLQGEADHMMCDAAQIAAMRVTSKIVTPEKTVYKLVADELPGFAEAVRPSLEDAYMYAMAGAERQP